MNPNETPTPPEGCRLIPRAYLEAGNPLPEDTIFYGEASDAWYPSNFRGVSSLKCNWRLHHATTQPLPCFQSPDQGPEHNPDGLTPEQYGAPEWRLLRKDEIEENQKKVTCGNYCVVKGLEAWTGGAWDNSGWSGDDFSFTYRRRVAPEPTAGIAEPFGKIDMALRITELERERDAARKEAADLRNSNANANVHVKMVEKERDEARAEAKGLRTDIAGFRSELDRLRTQLAASEKERGLAERRAAIWMSMIHELPAEKTRMFQEAAARFDALKEGK